MLPAILHSISLLVCLCVQGTGTPLAWAWHYFFLAGCAVLLYEGDYPKQGVLWYSALLWLMILAANCLLINPMNGSAVYMWMIAAMPVLALCLKERHIKPYIIGFGVVIAVFALNLMIQKVLKVHYTFGNPIDGIAWPLIDPNNAACVINFALIPAFYMMLKKPKWLAAVAFFAVALLLTKSKAGACAAAAGCSLIMLVRWQLMFALPAVGSALMGFLYIHYVAPWIVIGFLESFLCRLEIWGGAVKLLWIHPLAGIGLGMFGHYYQFVRLETFTQGWHCHNDILQFAIELGFPAAAAFCFMMIVAAVKTCKENIISAAVLLEVLLQSMVEFQFYIPPVSMLAGLALGYHMLLTKKPRKAIML